MKAVSVTTVLNGYLVSRENEQGHEEIRVAIDAQGLADAVKAFEGVVTDYIVKADSFTIDPRPLPGGVPMPGDIWRP